MLRITGALFAAAVVVFPFQGHAACPTGSGDLEAATKKVEEAQAHWEELCTKHNNSPPKPVNDLIKAWYDETRRCVEARVPSILPLMKLCIEDKWLLSNGMCTWRQEVVPCAKTAFGDSKLQSKLMKEGPRNLKQINGVMRELNKALIKAKSLK